VAREVQVIPDKVLVSGPESRLRAVNHLVTTAVDLDGHALDFEETAAVLSPDPLIKVLQPAVVTVRVPMQPPAEQTR
jgi:YbbR domain-containing protein